LYKRKPQLTADQPFEALTDARDIRQKLVSVE
jgi:hypothetical protein